MIFMYNQFLSSGTTLNRFFFSGINLRKLVVLNVLLYFNCYSFNSEIRLKKTSECFVQWRNRKSSKSGCLKKRGTKKVVYF